MEGFRTYLQRLEGNPLGGVDLAVYVLTTGFWPTQSAAKCNLPSEILSCCEVFKKYYLSNHSGRRLTWQTNMGTAELKANFVGGKKHELQVRWCWVVYFVVALTTIPGVHISNGYFVIVQR